MKVQSKNKFIIFLFLLFAGIAIYYLKFLNSYSINSSVKNKHFELDTLLAQRIVANSKISEFTFTRVNNPFLRKSYDESDFENVIEWPRIKYLGYIQSSKKRKLALLKIDDENFKVVVNDFVTPSLSVLKIEKDFIEVGDLKSSRFFYLSI